MPVFLLSRKKISFPSPNLAHEDGILAIGGDLSQRRLVLAYKMGIFPWFSEGEPIVWWSPDPRLVLFPDEIRVSKSLKKIIKKKVFQITFDKAFYDVITACADVRTSCNEGTWLGKDMINAYCRLYESGYAHSVEAWHKGKLAGGLYGVSMGRCFFGESMFTYMSNASKVAFVFLAAYLKSLSFDIIDCQVTTNHLKSFGAREIRRDSFLHILDESLNLPDVKYN